MSPDQSWHLEGMTKDTQGITREWQLVNQRLIDGVVVRSVQHVMTSYGYLTEIYRRDWQLDGHGVEQVFQVVLEPGVISGWHAHAVTTDRLFITQGRMRVVLYDARRSSPTFGCVNQFMLGTVRPALLVVPPGIWHAIQNIGSVPSVAVNVVDRAYDYENPDHFRLPPTTAEIPFRFEKA